MKFMVLNTKGGVGKSTVSVQVLVPYLWNRTGQTEKINLVEFDDENSDSETFGNSNILDAKRIKISNGDLDTNIVNTALDHENLVVDVGGNKTTTYILQSLENTNIIDVFDCAIIPLGDGEQDAINAVNVYKKLRDISNDIKIVFALSKVDKSMDKEIQFFDFFGDIKDRIDSRTGIIEQIEQSDRNIIVIYNDESVKVSRAFGITAYEISETNIDDLKAKMKEFLVNKENDKVKKTSYRITLINKAIKFRDETLIQCFKTLDSVVA